MSRPADGPAYRVPDPPSLPGALRAALFDFYYNSWRLVPANVLWGLGLLVVVGLVFSFPLIAFPLAIALAIPAAGIFRLATLIARDESVAFSDALGAWRKFWREALLTGVVVGTITFVLVFNTILGVLNPEPLLWIIATLSVWGLVATWTVALPFWALLTDPVRQAMGLRERLRLAVVLALVSPLRFGLLALLVTVIIVVSTIFFAALVTISIAFVALFVVRYCLPAADRLEQRETQVVPS